MIEKRDSKKIPDESANASDEVPSSTEEAAVVDVAGVNVSGAGDEVTTAVPVEEVAKEEGGSIMAQTPGGATDAGVINSEAVVDSTAEGGQLAHRASLIPDGTESNTENDTRGVGALPVLEDGGSVKQREGTVGLTNRLYKVGFVF
jgi:hypothetical protein